MLETVIVRRLSLKNDQALPLETRSLTGKGSLRHDSPNSNSAVNPRISEFSLQWLQTRACKTEIHRLFSPNKAREEYLRQCSRTTSRRICCAVPRPEASENGTNRFSKGTSAETQPKRVAATTAPNPIAKSGARLVGLSQSSLYLGTVAAYVLSPRKHRRILCPVRSFCF